MPPEFKSDIHLCLAKWGPVQCFKTLLCSLNVHLCLILQAGGDIMMMI